MIEKIHEVDGVVLSHQMENGRHRLVYCNSKYQIAGVWVAESDTAKVSGCGKRYGMVKDAKAPVLIPQPVHSLGR